MNEDSPNPSPRDDDTAVGDTPEAHDEISPHDLPKDHPGRIAAEEQAGAEDGVTSGDTDRMEATPSRPEEERSAE